MCLHVCIYIYVHVHAVSLWLCLCVMCVWCVCVFLHTYVFMCVQFLCMYVLCLLRVSVHVQGEWAEALGPGSGSFLHTAFSTGQRILCNLETFYLSMEVAVMKVTLLLSWINFPSFHRKYASGTQRTLWGRPQPLGLRPALHSHSL